MIICISGDRNPILEYYSKIKKQLLLYSQDHVPCLCKVLVGDCSGVDTFVQIICIELKIPFTVFKADWKTYGKRAGYLRNKKMIDEKPDLVLAFHNDIQNSKGTKMMIKLAEKHKIKYELIK